jgi:hypothetical protein
MKSVNMHPNMAMQGTRENSAQCLTKKISESTVRGFKSVYQKEIKKK